MIKINNYCNTLSISEAQRFVKYITVSSAYILIEQFSKQHLCIKQKAEAPKLNPEGRQNGWLALRTCHFQIALFEFVW